MIEIQDTMHKLEPGQFVWGNVYKIANISWGGDRNYRSMGSYIGLFTKRNSIVLLEWHIKFFSVQKVFPLEFLRKSLRYVFELTNYHFAEGYPEVAPVLSPFLKTYEYFPKIKNSEKFIQSLTMSVDEDVLRNNTYEFLVRI